MKSKIALIFILFAISISSVFAQNQFGVNIGANYGGPIPTELDTASYGAGLPGFLVGIEYKLPIAEKITLHAGLLYNLRQFKYGTTQKNDTVVDVQIGNTNASVPTYYTADIQGKAMSHQIDFRLPVHWNFNEKSAILFGPYLSYVAGGNDKTVIDVQIGEGTILDNVQETREGFDNINPFEFGFILGGTYHFSEKLSLNIEGVRAITPFYEDGYYASINEGVEVKFYQTYVFVRFAYFF
jgi:hypothetical protein